MANTYRDIPQASDILSQSQKDIRANFDYIANTLGTSLKSGDHQISLNGVDTTTFEGRHLQVALNNRSGGPPTVAGIGDGTDSLIYSSNGNLFYGSQLGAGAFQLTTFNAGANFGGLGTTSTTTPTAGAVASTNAGWTFLPGGLILQYGRILAPAATGIVNYPIIFPNNVLGVFFNFGRNASSTDSFWINTSGTNTTGTFSFRGSTSSAVIFYWAAIGN